MAVYHMYCAETDAEISRYADAALARYQAFYCKTTPICHARRVSRSGGYKETWK